MKTINEYKSIWVEQLKPAFFDTIKIDTFDLKNKEIEWIDMETNESHCYNCCLFDNGCKDIGLCKRPTSTFKGFYIEKRKK
jgi:hypothetical protein